jgi:TP901 family phage tail tape measure protein
MAGASGVKAGRAWIEITALDKTGKMLASIANKFRNFGTRLTSMGQTAFGGALATALPVGMGVKVFMDFDDAMRRVEARSSGTAAEMARLREQAKELGRTTSATAAQVGELQAILAQKGFSRTQIEQMTPGVLALARGAGTGNAMKDIEDATQAASTVLRSFGMSASESNRVADVLTTTVNNSAVSLESLIESFKFVGPLAKMAGMSLEDTAAAIGQMGNLSYEGTLAGTGLRRLLLELSSEAKRAKFNEMLKGMNGMSVEMVDAKGNLLPIPDILFSIGEAIKDLGSAEKAQVLEKLFGKIGITPAAILSGNKNPFVDLRKKLLESGGAAVRTQQMMESGIGGSWRMLTSAVEGLALAIGEALAGNLMAFSTWIQGITGSTARWVSENQATIIGIGLLIVSLGAGGAALMAMGLAVKVLSAGLMLLSTVATLIGGAFVFLASPVGIAIALFVALGAAVVLMSDTAAQALGNFLSFTSESFSGIISSATAGITGIKDALALGDIEAASAIAWASVKLIWLQGCDYVLRIWEGFKNAINGAVLGFTTGFLYAVSAFMTNLTLIWSVGWNSLNVIAYDFVAFFRDMIIGNLVPLLNTLADAMAYVSQDTADKMKGIIGQIDEATTLRSKEDVIRERDTEAKAIIDAGNKDRSDIVTNHKQKAESNRMADSVGKALRQQEIEAAKAEIKGLLTGVEEKKKEAEKKAANEWLQSNFDRLATPDIVPPEVTNLGHKNMGTPEVDFPAQTLDSLERGSVEAVKKAAENKNKPFEALLKVNESQLKELEELNDKAEDGATVEEYNA